MANSGQSRGVVYGFDSTSSLVGRELPTRLLCGEVGLAALFVDCQHYCCSRASPLASVARRDFDNDYFFDRVDRLCRPNWARLVRACRVAGVDVVTTVISSLRRDAKDISRDYKVTVGIGVLHRTNPRRGALTCSRSRSCSHSRSHSHSHDALCFSPGVSGICERPEGRARRGAQAGQ